ncbi:molybdenum cofactor biosysynthesis protein [Luteolibacter arcticus]|uniref:Molybdenum cofactor biosysynthesis protein n=1 Tax=Luteolibacter arcticus TaxID=1581411 RepID=A0ABT3GHR0_9BACT|nr:MOSC domain-containing protein [Luteolibacter arcticus]MCW1922914.1 molybdenum cofactor biosysynthesis protein [Luteolibacter arcticus]
MNTRRRPALLDAEVDMDANSHEGDRATAEGLPSWNARLVQIFISSGHDYWGRQGEGRMQHGINAVDEVECVAGMGLRGDRYFNKRPNARGQVTFFEQRVVEEIRAEFKLPKLPASIFRRNLIVDGVELAQWLGKRFIFQGLVFEGAQECRPCDWMDRVIAPGGEEFMKTGFRGGLRARIHTSGTLRTS